MTITLKMFKMGCMMSYVAFLGATTLVAHEANTISKIQKIQIQILRNIQTGLDEPFSGVNDPYLEADQQNLFGNIKQLQESSFGYKIVKYFKSDETRS